MDGRIFKVRRALEVLSRAAEADHCMYRVDDLQRGNAAKGLAL